MIPVANRYTVVLDASVLFAVTKRDLLLSFYEADLFRARWSEQIQQEWLRNALKKYPEEENSLDRVDQLMRQHFESAWVTGYEPFLNAVHLPDPDDHHVAAAAIACKAQHIVTDNLRDFPADALSPFDIEVGTADSFLTSTFEHYESRSLGVIRHHRLTRRTAPSASEYLMSLAAKELPRLSAALRPFSDSI